MNKIRALKVSAKDGCERLIIVLKNKFFMAEIIFFLIGKVLMALVELPSYDKTQSQMPYLVGSTVAYNISYIIKMYVYRKTFFKDILQIQIHAFILWIVSALCAIFAFSLCDALGWTFAQKMSVVGCIFIQTSIFVLLTSQNYISKKQFFFYEFILTANILTIAIKTVIFLQKESESPHKDLVLLNLTTQVALSIIIMDVVERSYTRYKGKKALAKANLILVEEVSSQGKTQQENQMKVVEKQIEIDIELENKG